ncbi:uncharacterized protein LY89DRAFT_227411 [Mollisia scopiformis]|uniref:NADPH-dependent FMN reductase-like domain-containing protein n=1 Tax=Mollisia scopiformis TaxID=149040 RepID=A0A194WUC6_MOLSC|nr:uncharacterized protein LY89DRAFT_227411 [Mollisia scopiformis]KUJ11563.1 hypothetical protein LY89DRAFT_227411 [Mollisia scopiformis]
MTHTAAKIGVIICSSRKPRACPQITDFIISTINSLPLRGDRINNTILTPIDLAEWNLPMFDESDVPSQVHDPSKYDHAHTRAWAAEVLKYDAFIFVVPQYNWGYPAVVKNAIDYLYHEWKGKAALVVSYGGHGGGKCNAQLRQVLCGVNMIPTQTSVELSFPGREFTVKAARGKNLELDGSGKPGTTWGGQEREQIAKAYNELLKIAGANVSESQE